MAAKASRKAQKKKGRTLTPLTPEQVEAALRHILTSTLALYVLSNTRKPISKVLDELVGMEHSASQLVGMVLRLQAEKVKAPNLNSVLAGVFSFVPSPGTSAQEQASKFRTSRGKAS